MEVQQLHVPGLISCAGFDLLFSALGAPVVRFGWCRHHGLLVAVLTLLLFLMPRTWADAAQCFFGEA